MTVRADGPSLGTILGPGATLNVSAADDVSGLSTLEVRQDLGPWTPYSDPLAAGGGGVHILDYRATDRVGNQATGGFPYTVDEVPPEVTVQTLGPAFGTVLSPTSYLAVLATDNDSGVASLDIRIDGGNWFAYVAPLPAGVEASHLVEYRATDRVGNVESGSHAYRVDMTGPSVVFIIIGPNVTAPTPFVAPTTFFYLTAVDPTGVPSVMYRVDGGSWIAYDAPFQLVAEGPHLIEYQATDPLGNPSALASFATTVDGSGPQVRLGLGSPNATVRGNVIVDDRTPFTVIASDAGAGLASMECAVAGSPRLCDLPFSLSGVAGLVDIDVRATDQLGNAATQVWSVFVDAAGPVAVIDALSGVALDPDRVAVFSGVRSTDAAGSEMIVEYTWDFGDGSQGSGAVAPHTFLRPGAYTVILTVTNVLGHAATNSIDVSVASTAAPGPATPSWVLPVVIFLVTLVLFLVTVVWIRRRGRTDTLTKKDDAGVGEMPAEVRPR